MKNFKRFVAVMLMSGVSIFAAEETWTAAGHEIEWLGKKVSGSHNGNISLAEGWLKRDGDKITGGSLKVDLTSMTCLDIKSPEWNKKLIDHLKSDDFFSTEKFPHAVLTIHEAIHKGEKIWVFNSELTIKGITHPLIFEGELEMEGSQLELEANLVIDRTKYEIRYGSGSFFKGLGDKLIYDQFEVKTEIKFAMEQAPAKASE